MKAAFEMVFVPMPDSCIRWRWLADGMWQDLRTIQYRCGICFQPVGESEMHRHAEEHKADWGKVGQ